jgi:hypothetical protein
MSYVHFRGAHPTDSSTMPDQPLPSIHWTSHHRGRLGGRNFTRDIAIGAVVLIGLISIVAGLIIGRSLRSKP